MAQKRSLRNAPIVEAVMELRVTQREGFSVESMKPLSARFADRFPKESNLRMATGEFKVANGKPSGGLREVPYGFRFDSADGRKIIQCSLDTFSFSWLAPYSSWEEFVGAGLSVWTEYLSCVKPVAVSRIGIRFVNRIELDVDGLDFDDYFLTTPRIPEGLPQTLAAFVGRVTVPIADSGSFCSVAMALDTGNKRENSASVVLDVDVFRTLSLKPDDAAIQATIDSFREIKNTAFFGMITERTVERYI